MSVYGIVGLPGSGKSEAASVARDLDIPVITMGDVIRQECRERGLDPATHHGEIAQALREENGPGAIAERSLPVIEEALREADRVVVEGVRSEVEVERFEETFGEAFTLVSVEAPFEVREERIETRGRDDTAVESLRERDERELDFGTGGAMDHADVVVENTESLEAFHDRIRDLLSRER